MKNTKQPNPRRQNGLFRGALMKYIYNWLLMISALVLAGCGGPSGGGSGSMDGRMIAYGIGKNGISFAIFTDIAWENTKASAGGESGVFVATQSGTISPASGQGLDYEAGADSIKLGGQKYEFEKGRVFLVTTDEAKRDIQQLNIPIEATSLSPQALRDEMRRLRETPEVGAVMNGSE